NGYDFIQIRSNYPFPSESEVQALHAAGVQNNYFYDNDPADFAGFLQSGMDFVLTDDPALVMGSAVAEGIVPLRAIYRGDFNMDGDTDTKDFGLFFQALVDPAGFAASNPGFEANIYGDYDASQLFDVQDYEGFYQAVTGGASIPGDYNLDGI